MASVEYVVRAVDEMTATLNKIGRNVDQLRGDLDKLSKTKSTPSVELQDKEFAAKYDGVKERLDALSKRVATARADVQDKEALAKLAALQVKLDSIGKRVESPKIKLDGLAKAEAQLLGLEASLDKAGESGAKAAGTSGVGALSGAAMPALVGAIAAAAPFIATLSFGLGGIGLAALGAGKHSKEFAQELAPLKTDVEAFQNQLQPVVLQDFAKAARTAQIVLHNTQPVAAAAGKALGIMFDQVNATFQSGTWQGFFAFMQRTAGPDIQLLTKNFTDLMMALPPLLEQLQPVATDLLSITDAVFKLTGRLAAYNQHIDQTSQHENFLAKTTDALRTVLFAPGVGLYHALKLVGIIGSNTAKGLSATAVEFGHNGDAAIIAASKVQSLADAVASLNTQLNNSIKPNATFNQDLINAAQAAHDAAKALDKSSGSISKNTQAGRTSATAMQHQIDTLVQLTQDAGKNRQKQDEATAAIRRALPELEHVKGGTREYWQEVRTLIAWLERERRERNIHKVVSISGAATWSLSNPGGKLAGPMAAGGVVRGGVPGRDSVPIMAMPGEVVVPTKMVAAGLVDHLRGALPGFAAGGIVPKYSGNVAGLVPWGQHNVNASNTWLINSMARAVAHAVTGALSRAFSGAGPARHASMPYLEGLWDAAGGPPGLAHLMAAIAMAESGGNPNAYNPSGATGLWQILGAVNPADQPFLRNPAVNAHEAVLKWRTQGLGAWVTYTSGAYKQFYGNGLRGGIFTRPTPIVVGDKQPERVDVTPLGRPGGRGGALVNIEQMVVQDATDAELVAQRLSHRVVAAALS